MANEEKKEKLPENGGEKPAGRRTVFRRLSALALVLLAVLAVVVLTTMEDGSHFAGLRRWLMYGDSGGTENQYAYAADQNNRFARLEENLLLVNPNTVQILSDDGTALYELQVNLTAPSVSVGSKQAAVCDVGGTSLYLFSEAGLLRTMEMEGELCYYAARLNSRDYLAVTEQKSGYKASVLVYSDSGDLVFHFDSHDAYISDAVVTDDCRYLVAVSLDPQDGAFGSTLLVYDLAAAERVSQCVIRDGLVLDMALSGQEVISLCDTRLTIHTLDGQALLDYPYGSLYLHEYALTGEDFCALLLGRYQAGNVCQLMTFDLAGQPLATLEVTEEVLDLSAAGAYLAVLYSDSLVIYTSDLAEYARLEGTDYAGEVIMNSDGTALVLSGTSAWRFLP